MSGSSRRTYGALGNNWRRRVVFPARRGPVTTTAGKCRASLLGETDPLSRSVVLRFRAREEASTCREVNCKTEEGSDIRIGGCDVVVRMIATLPFAKYFA